MTLFKLPVYFLLLLVLNFSNVTAFEIREADLDQVKLMPVYEYPIEGLAEELKAKGVESMRLFAYGSLLSYQSALKALSARVLKTRKPSIALGVKRTFSRDVPIKEGSHWKQPYDRLARGMLNLLKTDQVFDYVNGVIIDVPIEELESLLNREQGYDLVPVLCLDWDKEEKQKIYIAYAFCAKPNGPYTSQEIKPRPLYYELSRDASKDYGPGFYYAWLNTTYFADGKTSIFEWETLWRENKEETQAR